jgi:CheY-like chemotaxis protein
LHPMHSHLNPSCHILIVDGSATMRARLKKQVRSADLPAGELYEASDADETLEALAAHPVDLALVDLTLASATGDGRDLIGRILSEPSTRTTAVIALAPASVRSDPRQIARLRRRGVKACLPRPFTAEALRVAVADALELSLA